MKLAWADLAGVIAGGIGAALWSHNHPALGGYRRCNHYCHTSLAG